MDVISDETSFRCVLFGEGRLFRPGLVHACPEPGFFGGFLEARSRSDAGRHLGVDICVEENCEIAVLAPCDGCRVVHRMMDTELENGWGGRLILRLPDAYCGCEYLIVGHLASGSLAEADSVLHKGQMMGHVAPVAESGTWFRHIHVQLASALHLRFFADHLDELDGYCHDLDECVDALTADPSELIFVQNVH